MGKPFGVRPEKKPNEMDGPSERPTDGQGIVTFGPRVVAYAPPAQVLERTRRGRARRLGRCKRTRTNERQRFVKNGFVGVGHTSRSTPWCTWNGHPFFTIGMPTPGLNHGVEAPSKEIRARCPRPPCRSKTVER